MVVLMLFLLTLIAVWGSSERWDAAVARRWVGRCLRALRHPHATHPFDWDDL